MGNSSAQDRVLSLIRPDDVLDLAVALGNVPSPTGDEKAVGDILFEWLKKEGFHPFRQQAAEGRYNIIARLPGKGGGKSLIFNAHMDTAVWAPHDLWLVGEEKPV